MKFEFTLIINNLTNSLPIFQSMMKFIYCTYLKKMAKLHLDNILMNFNIKKIDLEVCKKILKNLSQHQL